MCDKTKIICYNPQWILVDCTILMKGNCEGSYFAQQNI